MSAHVDTPTLVLGGAVLAALALTYKLRPPPSQIHPFLLGRQAASAPTRNERESPVYRSSANGGVRAPYRPDRALRTLADIVARTQTCFEGGGRGLWLTGGDRLLDVVTALRAGLVNALASTPGRVLVAVEDPTDALLVTLALATSQHKPIVIAPGSAVPADLDFAAVVRTQNALPANFTAAKVINLDEADREDAQELLATGKQLVADGKDGAASAGDAGDLALSLVSEGIRLDLTNQNLTASLVSWTSLFPPSPKPTKPTIKDFVLSFHHPSTPYGLGLALMLIYHSASLSFAALPDLDEDADNDVAAEALVSVLSPKDAPPTTLIFAPAATLAEPLYKLLLLKMLGDSSFIVRQARDGKLRLLREGSVSKQTFWDSLLFKGLRKDVRLSHLRALFLASPPALAQSRLETLRSALGCPVVPTLEHALLVAPLANAHMWDVQRLPPPGLRGPLTGAEKNHVGAPTLGVEIKLSGKEDEIAAGRIKGEILLRSPLLPHPSTLPSSLLSTDSSLPQLPPYPGQSASSSGGGSGAEGGAGEGASSRWLRTGVHAEMSTEGTLWLQ
ncbi:uncharacterized protein JCM10292_007399 [Rhodotorula paludigena]|uniref:uncharacterized protein n=1 Tax=Rhodotorula paludigena TaxID=86838 RepID=UPI00317AF0D3